MDGRATVYPMQTASSPPPFLTFVESAGWYQAEGRATTDTRCEQNRDTTFATHREHRASIAAPLPPLIKSATSTTRRERRAAPDGERMLTRHLEGGGKQREALARRTHAIQLSLPSPSSLPASEPASITRVVVRARCRTSFQMPAMQLTPRVQNTCGPHPQSPRPRPRTAGTADDAGGDPLRRQLDQSGARSPSPRPAEPPMLVRALAPQYRGPLYRVQEERPEAPTPTVHERPPAPLERCWPTGKAAARAVRVAGAASDAIEEVALARAFLWRRHLDVLTLGPVKVSTKPAPTTANTSSNATCLNRRAGRRHVQGTGRRGSGGD